MTIDPTAIPTPRPHPFRAILTDAHFLVPVAVLLFGVLLLVFLS